MSDFPARFDHIKEALLELELLSHNHPEEFFMWSHMLDPIETAIRDMNDFVTEQWQKG